MRRTDERPNPSSDSSRALLDIMLGFLRSRLDKEQMMLQQRKAVDGILAWVDSQDEVKVTGNTHQASAGEHLDWVRTMTSRCIKYNSSNCHYPLPFSTSIAPSRITCSMLST